MADQEEGAVTAFKPGEIAFFKGLAAPVTIVKETNIWDGTDGSRPGYEVIMEGWHGPETRSASSLISYEDNLSLMESELTKAIDQLVSAARTVESRRVDLDRLLRWGERNRK